MTPAGDGPKTAVSRHGEQPGHDRAPSERRMEVSLIRILDFGFVSDFVLRISDFRLGRFVQVLF
jgi:hypothetical protein